MRYSPKMREEELKNKVAQDFFGNFDCTEIIKNIDFAVKIKKHSLHEEYLLWAEAKKASSDIAEMLAQLFLTIGKARNLDKISPQYLGCFDCGKIAFVDYSEINDIFNINDFDWKVAPSDRTTKEFKQVCEKIRRFDKNKIFIFDFEKDEKELKSFIKENFDLNPYPTHKIRIDKRNFRPTYNRWLEAVKPTILMNWDYGRRIGIVDGDFYLADLLSRDNNTMSILDSLFVLLKTDCYTINRRFDKNLELFTSMDTAFTDNQQAHKQFWAIYERPPENVFWEYMVDRRDLLVSRDMRERKGSFFTPEIWVKLSQKYIADVFGKNWQEEYYVWDCAAGTGNLLAGLTEANRIWASTIDQADVDTMHTKIKKFGMNLLEKHCFQFDFLNDNFNILPKKLQHIIKNTPEKLIVYINPPYVEGDARIGRGRRGVHESLIHDKYQSVLGRASAELFAQFLIRIYKELQGCKIANFAKLKALCASNFGGFRKTFKAKLEKLFLVPADTFDNVDGDFPIGFHIWNPDKKTIFKKIKADVYDKDGKFLQKKNVFSYDDSKYISDWLAENPANIKNSKNPFVLVGHLASVGSDFQHQRDVYIDDIDRKHIAGGRHTMISAKNLTCVSIYFAVRHCIEPTWLNDRDQFLYPNDGWQTDKEFQNDCLVYTLFHNGNNISSKYGVNHWIPFTENEVNACDSFDSNFMTDFIRGKIKSEKEEERSLFKPPLPPPKGGELFGALVFSPEAQAVFAAGRKLWQYYHLRPKCDVNASLYDIREHFQSRNAAGRMNSKSENEKYTELIENLRAAIKVLAKKIEPKVYEYGFLKD